MRKYVCDKCGVVIHDDVDVHKIVMCVKDINCHDEYFKNIEFCTNCANELVSKFDDFLSYDKELTNDERYILETMPRLRKLAVMAGFEL